MADLDLKASSIHLERGRQLADKGDLKGALTELNEAG